MTILFLFRHSMAPKKTQAKKKGSPIKPADIDWVKAKAEYLKYKGKTIAPFLREYLGIENITTPMKRKTKGWAEEKKKLMEGAVEDTKGDLEDKLKEDLKKAYEVPREQLEKLKKGVFDILMARLGQVTNNIKVTTDPQTGKQTVVVTGDVPTKELIDILKVVKTEMGEPTNINQSQLGDDEKNIMREINSIEII